LGLLVPEVQMQPDSLLAENEFRFDINEAKFPRKSGLQAGEFLINETVEKLKRYRIDAKPMENPATGTEAAVVADARAKDLCVSVGLTAWDCAGYLVLELSEAIRKSAAKLLTAVAAQFVLDNFETVFPRLGRAARE